MIAGNKSHHYLEVDEIDHLTLSYKDFGKSLDRDRAVKMILFYSDAYDEVRKSLDAGRMTKTFLDNLDDKALYDILIIIRTVLLDAVL